MTDEIERYRVPLFNDKDFNNWKFRMENLLSELEFIEFIFEDYKGMVTFEADDDNVKKKSKAAQIEENEKKDRKCRCQIIQRLADSHLEYVKDKDSAYDMWKSLSETFERKSTSYAVTQKALTYEIQSFERFFIEPLLEFR